MSEHDVIVIVAIVGEIPLERLAHAIPAFPTRSEFWLRLNGG